MTGHERGEPLGRRKNFGFEKRQRQLKKQKKKADKAERRRLKSAESAEETAAVEGDAEIDPDGDDEIAASTSAVDEIRGSARAD